MIEPILIRGNKRMSIYGQLEYEKNQQSYYTWNKELDFIIKQYPITNPVYEYDEFTRIFNIKTKVNVSVLTERQKKFLDFDPWNRPLRKWIPETKVADNSHFSRKYGRGPFDWLDTYDHFFRWTTIENKGIQFYKYL
jgi:hypothetical protein